VVRATPVAPALAAEPVAPAVEPATAPVRPAPAVTTTTLAAPPATITTLAAPAVTTTTLAPPPIATHSALAADVPADPPTRRPVSVAIEELGVVAPVVATGVDPETGQLAIPGDAGTVVWYEHGAAPGAEGSAVLAGHVDFNGHRGVFFDLAGVEVGSIVSVTHDDGTSTSFQVVDRQSHPKPDLPTSELFRRQGDPTLVLITCGGEFDRAARSYRSNVVVTAVPLR
jgi:hypothetical protein